MLYTYLNTEKKNSKIASLSLAKKKKNKYYVLKSANWTHFKNLNFVFK